MNPEQLNPQEALQALLMDYMEFASATKADTMLNATVKSDVMLKMAQAVGILAPLLTNDGQAELELKAQEHQMNMQAKQQEMEMKAQEHQMKLQHSQNEHSLKLQQSQANHQNMLAQSQQKANNKPKGGNE